MGRTILVAGVLPFVSAFLGGTLALNLTKPVLVEAQAPTSVASPLEPAPCPSGPGVIPTTNAHKTLIMPPSLFDSTTIGFSHGVRSGNLLFIAGERGRGPDFEAQTRNAFATIQAILETAGGSLDDLVLTTTYLADPGSSPEYSNLRREILGPDLPAGGRVVVSGLGQSLVEVQAIAVLPCR